MIFWKNWKLKVDGQVIGTMPLTPGYLVGHYFRDPLVSACRRLYSLTMPIQGGDIERGTLIFKRWIVVRVSEAASGGFMERGGGLQPRAWVACHPWRNVSFREDDRDDFLALRKLAASIQPKDRQAYLAICSYIAENDDRDDSRFPPPDLMPASEAEILEMGGRPLNFEKRTRLRHQYKCDPEANKERLGRKRESA